jgi:hypothetical protein
MPRFQHQLWGFQIDLPDNWQHLSFGDKDGFSIDPEAFRPDYQGETLAQLLINGEWNSLKQPLFDLWQKHLGKVSLLLGAKNLASAEWEMAGARGFEVEIVLPKKDRRRLWTGILENGMLVLSFLALHWKDSQPTMEPTLSRMISSLEFIKGIDGLVLDEGGFPVPHPVHRTNPLKLIPDIPDPENWKAYRTGFTTGGLQAFYLRELPRLGWELSRFVPYPNHGDYPFARIIMEKEGSAYSLGLVPDQNQPTRGNIVLKKDVG